MGGGSGSTLMWSYNHKKSTFPSNTLEPIDCHQNPEYIGDGLRNKLSSWLFTIKGKPRSTARDCTNNKGIPAKYIRELQNSPNNIPQNTIVNRMLQSFSKYIKPRKNSRDENCKTYNKYSNSYFKYIICHIKRIIKRLTTKYNKTQAIISGQLRKS